jgi:hypothetical protein
MSLKHYLGGLKMKRFGLSTKKVGSLGVFVVLTAILCFFQSPAEAVTTTTNVNCPTDSLQSAIDNASSGDILIVSGTCSENITLNKSGLTLNGGGTSTTTGATITGANTQPVILVEAHNTIEGFTITGGSFGVAVVGGGAAIANNIIQGNSDAGILVTDNATAFIGILTVNDTTASPNTITLNGGNGIKVIRSSSARIIGNTISANGADGILVDRVSQADIAGNAINGNSMNGVEVSENSCINLGNDKTTIFGLPNYTYTKNLLAGIACNVGGCVTGFEGSLNGVKGALSTDPSCVKNFQIAANAVLLIGDWTVTYVNPPKGGDPKAPVQVTVNPDGTGTDIPTDNSGSQQFTWSLLGNKLIITVSSDNSINSGAVTWQDSNDFTYVFTSSDNPGTHIFKFHRIAAAM